MLGALDPMIEKSRNVMSAPTIDETIDRWFDLETSKQCGYPKRAYR
jgi:hypothetical protein